MTADVAGQAIDVEATGARIEGLLDRVAAEHGAGAATLAEDLVRELVALYGAGLERVLTVVDEQASESDGVLRAVAADPLVAGLLAVHDLHPVAVADRVTEAVVRVREATGADIRVLDVTGQTVTLHLDVSGCASTRATLHQSIEAAVQRAAPEVTDVRVESPDDGPAAGTPGALIPAESLLVRPGSAP